MLGWVLYFIMACSTGLPDNLLWRSSSHLYSGISRFLTVFEEKSLKVFATSVSLDSTLSLLTKIIVSLDLTLSVRKGLTVCQNFLLSVISFSFNLAKYSFFSFSEGRQSSFFVCYRILCLGRRFFKNLFLKRVLCIMAFEYALVYGRFIFPTNILLFSGCVFVKNILANFRKLIRIFAVVNLVFTESIMQGIYKPFIVKFF